MKKQLILGAFLLTSAGVVVLGAPRIYAQSATEELTLVERLAQRFGANPDDVQKVFDEDRAARQAQMKAKFEERLAGLVSEGKLTEEQQTKILEKHAAMEQERASMMEELKDLSPQERRARMEQKHQELTTWAAENGIDVQYVFGGFGKGMHKGMMWRGQQQ